jgi:GntR family transcriptional regulator
VRRRGSGTFARDKVTKVVPARDIASLIDNPRSVATNTTVRLLEFKFTPIPDFLHREWPEFGATVLTVRRIRFVDREPVALVTSYLPEAIGRQLSARRLGSDTITAALDKLGLHATDCEKEMSAVAADPATAKHLGFGVGSPVLNLKSLERDTRGRILRYANYLYRPDRYEIHTVVERPRGRQATRI